MPIVWIQSLNENSSPPPAHTAWEYLEIHNFRRTRTNDQGFVVGIYPELQPTRLIGHPRVHYQTTGWTRWLSRAEANHIALRTSARRRPTLFFVYLDHPRGNGSVKLAVFQFRRRADNAAFQIPSSYAPPDWAEEVAEIAEEEAPQRVGLSNAQVLGVGEARTRLWDAVKTGQSQMRAKALSPIVRTSIWDRLSSEDD